jgi:hypothetical protein
MPHHFLSMSLVLSAVFLSDPSIADISSGATRNLVRMPENPGGPCVIAPQSLGQQPWFPVDFSFTPSGKGYRLVLESVAKSYGLNTKTDFVDAQRSLKVPLEYPTAQCNRPVVALRKDMSFLIAGIKPHTQPSQLAIIQYDRQGNEGTPFEVTSFAIPEAKPAARITALGFADDLPLVLRVDWLDEDGKSNATFFTLSAQGSAVSSFRCFGPALPKDEKSTKCSQP